MASDVKWIKIVTDIFDDEKIVLIESMPEADAIIVIWFKLLCLAGKQNNDGVFLLNERVPYNVEMFAHVFRRPLNTVRMALRVFEQYGMIEIINDTVTIPNWSKHQQLDSINKRREYMRNLMAKRRAEQKELAQKQSLLALTGANELASVSAPDIDRERDKNKSSSSSNARARVETPFGDVDIDPLIIKVQKELNGLTDTHYSLLEQYRQSLGDELISYAIDQAVANGSRNWAYVERILQRFEESGIRSVGEAKADEERRRRGKNAAQQYLDDRGLKDWGFGPSD